MPKPYIYHDLSRKTQISHPLPEINFLIDFESLLAHSHGRLDDSVQEERVVAVAGGCCVGVGVLVVFLFSLSCVVFFLRVSVKVQPGLYKFTKDFSRKPDFPIFF